MEEMSTTSWLVWNVINNHRLVHDNYGNGSYIVMFYHATIIKLELGLCIYHGLSQAFQDTPVDLFFNGQTKVYGVVREKNPPPPGTKKSKYCTFIDLCSNIEAICSHYGP